MNASTISTSEPISFGCPAYQKDDRFRAYDVLREQAPVYQDPVTGNYILTRYADLRSVLINHKIFSNDCGMISRRESPVRQIVDQIYLAKGPLPGRNLQTYDPPEHRVHRAPVDRAFDHWNVMSLRDHILEQANLFIDPLADAGTMEFVGDFAIRFPLRVFSDQLGIAHEDAGKLKLWADTAIEEIDPSLSPEREIEIAHVLAGMYEYFQHALAEARAKPDDRLISKLVQMNGPDGQPLALAELLEILRALVVAAGDTTTYALAGGMRLLVEAPELVDIIRNDENKLNAFVEEALRITSPVQTLFRRARQDAIVAGIKIPKGALIEARYGAANLDPAVFECPMKVDLERDNGRSHIAFGAGVHSCLGMLLARTEMQIGFKALVDRLDNFRAARGEDSFILSPSYIANGPIEAYIDFEKRSGRPMLGG